MKSSKVTEFTACAECDSQDEIRTASAGDESLSYCEACQTVEGNTRTLWSNDETEEITADIAVANSWDGEPECRLENHGEFAPFCTCTPITEAKPTVVEKPCRIEGRTCMSTTNAPGTFCEKCGNEAFND